MADQTAAPTPEEIADLRATMERIVVATRGRTEPLCPDPKLILRLLARLDVAEALLAQANEALSNAAAHWHVVEGAVQLTGDECPGCKAEGGVARAMVALDAYLGSRGKEKA